MSVAPTYVEQTHPMASNAHRLSGELAALPDLAPVVGPNGVPSSRFMLVTTPELVALTAPSDADQAAIDAVLAAHDPTPDPPVVLYDRSIEIKAQVRTTDDVPLEVFRFPCDPKHRYRASLACSGIDAVSGVSRDLEGRFVWKRATGNAVMVGVTVVSTLGEAASSSWAPAATASGTDVVFTVKGAVGRTVDWLLRGIVDAFAPEGLEG